VTDGSFVNPGIDDGVNDAPIVVDDTLAGDEDNVIVVTDRDLFRNDFDIDAFDILTVTAYALTDPAGPVTLGTVTDTNFAPGGEAGYSVEVPGSLGTITYDPRAAFDHLKEGEVATDVFGYTLTDAGGLTDTGTVTVTITGINDLPRDTRSEGEFERAVVTTITTAMLDITDPDNTPDEVMIRVTEDVRRGALLLDGAGIGAGDTFSMADVIAGRLAYDHDASVPRTDGFDFEAFDKDNPGALLTGRFEMAIVLGPDDVEFIGTGGNDHFVGGIGNDRIIGRGGNDHLVGGRGDDGFNGGGGDDFIDAGEGDDHIVGGAGGDRINAGAGDDFVRGDGGDDNVWAGDGDDTVMTGAGSDRVEGGSGNDTVVSGAGHDVVFGGDGNDLVNLGNGHDEGFGGQGNDTILAGAGHDRIFGETGDDRIDAGSGRDEVSGGSGDDVVNAGSGADRIFGDDGDDRLHGGAGHDAIHGGSGEDTLNGGSGHDTLFGNGDADVFVFTGGRDVFEDVRLDEFDRVIIDVALTDTAEILAAVSQSGPGGTLLAFTGSDTLFLRNLDVLALSEAEFTATFEIA